MAKASPRQFVLAALLQVLGAVAATALVYAAKLTLDVLLTTDPGDAVSLTDVTSALVVLALATAVSGAAGSLQAQQQRLLAEDISTQTWRELLEVTGRVDLGLLESPSFAERSDRLQNNALGRPLTIATATLGLVGSAVTVVALTTAVLAIEPLLVPVLLLAGLPSILLSRKASSTEMAFVRRWSPSFRLRHYYRRVLSEQAFAKEVRSFHLQPEAEQRHLRLSGEYRAGLGSHVRRRQLLGVANALVTGAVLAGALTLIVWLVSAGRMSLSGAGAAVVAVRLLSAALDRVFASVGSILESSDFLNELHVFLQEAAVMPASSPAPLALRSGVALRGVGFRYPETDRDVLADVDLEILPGQLVALVGENGSGKSTLAKIVAGLYAPTQGEVCWDGQPVDDPLRAAVRASVSAIYQDFVLYDLSVADNVELTSSHDPERIRAALRAAGMENAVLRLPHGLDTILGRSFEGAVELSGGQWQRVALARALVRPSSLLVLDEPSSALDPRTEHELFSDLRRLAGDRAVLLVSHRYGNLHLADRIVVLQEGRVVDQGTHDELIARQGLYAQLYGLQAGSYRVS
ncbi:ABC transporter ATP-binding protein [Geodermatophilus sp. SYSU D01036]